MFLLLNHWLNAVFFSDACREAFFARSGATKNEIAYEEVTDGSHYDTLLHKKLSKPKYK